MSSKKVCVLGLGQIGLPVALYTSGRGFETWGYDISPIAVQRASENKVNATSDWASIPKADVYLVCVSTGFKAEEPDLSPLFEVMYKIREKAAGSEYLVSSESTIMPGVSRRIHREVFKESVKLVHAPHRYWPENSTKYGVNQVRLIGGINGESLRAGLEFYRGRLGIPMREVSLIEVAEMCKIAENAYRYVSIAFAEELKMVCDRLSLSFEEVRAGCNTKWNTNILEARQGIGGHCLPKDIRYLESLSPEGVQLLEGAIRADEQYRETISKRKGGFA